MAVPDLTQRHSNPSDALSLGFIAINDIQSEAADLVLEQPTAIDGADVDVMHFSSPFTLPATSRLLCIPLPL
eukprot:COSAG06_NODE_10699_length_1632_cov_1.677756_2_plen_72_part_00